MTKRNLKLFRNNNNDDVVDNNNNVVVIDDNNNDDNNNNRSNGVQMLLELFTPCQKERKNIFPPKVVAATVAAMPTRKSDNAEKFVTRILSDAINIVRV